MTTEEKRQKFEQALTLIQQVDNLTDLLVDMLEDIGIETLMKNQLHHIKRDYVGNYMFIYDGVANLAEIYGTPLEDGNPMYVWDKDYIKTCVNGVWFYQLKK